MNKHIKSALLIVSEVELNKYSVGLIKSCFLITPWITECMFLQYFLDKVTGPKQMNLSSSVRLTFVTKFWGTGEHFLEADWSKVCSMKPFEILLMHTNRNGLTHFRPFYWTKQYLQIMFPHRLWRVIWSVWHIYLTFLP